MRAPKKKIIYSVTEVVVNNLAADFVPAVTYLSPSLKGTGEFMPTDLSELKRCVTTEDMAAIVSSIVW